MGIGTSGEVVMAGDDPRVPDCPWPSEGRSTIAASPRRRVRAEYREMPGLLLTEGQAARLFGLESDVCREVLATLVGEGFLVRTLDGRYARQGACPRCQ